MGEREFIPERRASCPASEKYRAAQHQHGNVRGDRNRERNERHHHDRNTHLGKHSRAIWNRQRFPEQDAAVAAFAVECIETVKDGHKKTDGHEHERNEVIRPLDTEPLRTTHRIDEKPKEKQAGHGYRRDVDGTALP